MTRTSLAALLLGSLLVACGGGGGGDDHQTPIDAPTTHAVCGDGIVDVGTETCDDGNTTSGDGCSSTCQIETVNKCGNGQIDGTEACDDGNQASNDGCSAQCTVEAGYTCTGTPSVCAMTCGNGVVDAGETCDDHNMTAGDGCDATCHTEPGYTCSGMPSTCISGGTCAMPFPLALTLAGGLYTGTGSGDTTNATDGFHAAACDGEASSGGAPDQTWVFTNPIAQPVLITVQGATTSFDAAVRMTTTACDVTTQVPDNVLPSDTSGTADGCADLHGSGTSERLSYNMLPAGTYYITIDGFESDSVGTYSFTVAAGVQNTCGNGVVETGETCDDGNTAAADGCSAACQIETTYACSNEPSTCHHIVCGDGIIDGTEECDSNGAHDRCDANCHLVFDTTDTEANNDGAHAQVITPTHHIIKGSLPVADLDVFKFTLTVASVVEIETYTTFESSYTSTSDSSILNLECKSADTLLHVFNGTDDPTVDANSIYDDDDGGDGVCSYLGPTGALAPGTYYFTVHEYQLDNLIPRYLVDFKVTPM